MENSSKTTPNPTTFLDLLNNTYDDADLVHMLAEATDLTSAATRNSFDFRSNFEEPGFNQLESTEFQNFGENLDLVDEDAEYEAEYEGGGFEEGIYFENEYVEDELQTDLIYMEEDMLTEAIGSDLTKGDSVPHLWQNLEKEWTEFNHDLRLTSGIGRIKKGKKGPRPRSIPPNLRALVGEANLHYVNRDYPRAIEVLQEVIKIDPNIHSAWFTLGTIQDEMGCPDKALQLYLVAAHLTPHDGALWKRLGLLSKNHNAVHQAIYCFSKAIRCDHNDVDAIWDRSILYSEIREFKKAIDGFNGLLEKIPYDMNVLREITRIQVQMNEIPQAIDLFLDAFAYYRNRPFPEDPEAEGSFGYSEINIMAELYMLAGDYNSAIDFIKRGVRWLQGRENEIWWDYINDDREYDEEENLDRRDHTSILAAARLRGANSTGGTNATLPIELRVKLGQCRISTDRLEEGKLHFAYLESYDVEQYVDLYYEVAETYTDKGLFEDALAIYEAVVVNESTDKSFAWMRMGMSHRELGNLESAAEYFAAVVKELPDNLDVKMALAETYEDLDEKEKALEMVNEVLEARKEKHIQTAAESKVPSSTSNQFSASFSRSIPAGSLQTEASLIQTVSEESKANAFARAEEERKQKIAEKEKETKIQFHRLDLLYGRSRLGDSESAKEFLETARNVVVDWKNNRAFYPQRDRMLPFKGWDRRRSWRKQAYFEELENSNDNDDAYLDEQATTMAKRLQWRIDGEKDELEDEIRKKITEFNGIIFEKWFDFFIKYIVTSTKNKCEQEAFDLLKLAGRANVFFHNIHYTTVLKLLSLAWGLHTRNFLVVCENARWLCNYKPFNSNLYDLYGAGMSSGSNALSCFAAANSQKYFLRQVKLMDTGFYQTPIIKSNSEKSEDGSKQKHVLKKAKVPEKPVASLLSLYGHILACARSYVGAIGYYSRAYSVKPKDPLISLSMGLAYMHRSMQRISDNRHLQIMQAEYNLGRAFHELGLYHLAVPHYERCLELPSLQQVFSEQKGKGKSPEKTSKEYSIANDNDSTCLRRDAAYNLSMIYVENGSPGLAAVLLKKYCTI
ncbi:13782_t:CDS:10 [Funneliformis caledonium]|uniref:13782_t:CDS:1 n=1 Tax=Funneliformis caledonium TaxID=1117310 RepID=A0A9N9A4Z4_9GLOM|nr:13782_t:CDS:10 [Funneliformis caledonium]